MRFAATRPATAGWSCWTRTTFAELEPEPSRVIEVLRFVDPVEVPHLWYDRPYFLGPDGEGALEHWAALASALKRTGRIGIVRWTMRRKGYRGALRLHGDTPILVTLRSTSEVRSAGQLQAPEGQDLTAKEDEMAERLVEMLAGSFDPSEWADSWRERVMELIEAKAEGQMIAIEEYRAPAGGGRSLEEALAASLEDRGRKRA